MMQSRTALIMAGGTGGHVFPALAVAKALQARGWNIEWLGSADRMETRLVPAHHIPLHCLNVSGVRGGGWKKAVKAPFMLLKAVWQAMRVLRQVKPAVVLGFGGFASGPGGLAAFLCRKPLLIHEQNAIAGMTNHYLSKMADNVLQAFPGALPEADVVGNPVRDDIINLPTPAERFDGRNGPIRVLILGGSQGSVALNTQLPTCLPAVFSADTAEIRHQCGRQHADATQAAYQESELTVTVSEFIDDMAAAYSWADLVICRAGALTVSEVAAAGVAALFIPFPAAVDDHQTRNADYLVKAGAAALLQQRDLNATTLAQVLETMQQREQLLSMAQLARQQSMPDSAEQVATLCEEMAHD